MTMTWHEMIARSKLEGRSTKDLINCFILTGFMNDANIPTVRGWIMDELKKRDADAFDRWLEESAEDEELLRYFKIS